MPAAEMALGPKLQKAREARNLSRLELSERSGIPVTSIWRYEEDRQVPGVIQLVKLTSAMDGVVIIDKKGIEIV